MSSRRPQVFVSRSDFVPEAIQLLKKKCDVEQYGSTDPIPRKKLLQLVRDKDGLFVSVCENIDKEVLDAAGRHLKCISTVSVGYDHISIDECRKSGKWTTKIMGSGFMVGVDIAGSTVGIIGMGRIGTAVAKRLHAFEPAKMLYLDVVDSVDASRLGAQRVSLQTLLKQSDFVLCCCALTADTKELLNEDAFSQMKSSAIFVNTSRGGIVNQDALYAALASGRLRAAALDVMTPEPLPKDHPLAKLDNCVLMPHVGSATSECRRRMDILAVENLMAGMNNEVMPGEV